MVRIIPTLYETKVVAALRGAGALMGADLGAGSRLLLEVRAGGECGGGRENARKSVGHS